MEYIAFLVAVAFFILLEAFFSGSELALVSVNRAKLGYLAKRDRLIRDFLNDTESYITLTLFGYTFSIVLATAFYTYFWIKIAENHPALRGYEPLLAETLLVFTLVLGEIIPKSVFLSNAEFLAPIIIRVLYPLKKFFKPITYTAKLISDFIARVLVKEGKYLTREELVKILTEGKVELSKTKRLLVANILSFKERRISEIVKPLYDVVMVSQDATVEQAAEKIKESGYSRLPVYASTPQNIIGYVQAYDLLTARKHERIIKYVRPIKVIGEFEKLKDVLDKMVREKEHIAVVVDERGILIGIITLEDIMEEITGELYEKSKKEEEEIKQIGSNRWLVSANIEVSELNKLFNLGIPGGIYTTLGGFVQYNLGRLPKKGDYFEWRGFLFRVVEADEKKVKKVLIEKKG
ncbi:MAG: HlyC/CorC family transporter [Aquificae bacterium]|nr:HlyC/CorC family transporter [Aquificota bacterium]